MTYAKKNSAAQNTGFQSQVLAQLMSGLDQAFQAGIPEGEGSS
jgi:hypothetical protein